MKCVVLFGGRGTRVSHLSGGGNKALIEVLGKPVAFYVLQNLLKHFSDILIITTPDDESKFSSLAKEFENSNITVKTQDQPEGVAHALSFSDSFINQDDYFSLCLGDFYSLEIDQVLRTFSKDPGAYITLSEVKDPSKYGVLDFERNVIVEKPKTFISNWASRGFYILPRSALSLIPSLKKSTRGEYEIVDLLNKIPFKTKTISKAFDLGSDTGISLFSEYLNTQTKEET